jgi:hypothetical protein
MKTLLVTLIFFIQLPIVFGQDSTTNTFKNQLGVDATFFIKTYFQFNEFTGNPIPNYMLTYKRNFEKIIFRSALGVNFESFFQIRHLLETAILITIKVLILLLQPVGNGVQ